MELTHVAQLSTPFVEGIADEPFLTNPHAVDRLIEVCFAAGVRVALLYSAHMPPAFFDLSSGQAGIILQKLRIYGIRLAVVAPRGQVVFSRLFGDMLADEQRDSYFGVFDTRQEACDWIEQHSA
jgi:hypothetical protein